MRSPIGSLIALTLLAVTAPAPAAKLTLNTQAGQVLGVSLDGKPLPAQGLGGFYVRRYSAQTGPDLLPTLPKPLPEHFALDPAQARGDRPVLRIELPEDADTDSGYLNLRAPVTAGRTYLLRFAHKGERLGGACPPIVHLRQLDATGRYVTGQNNVELFFGSYDWKEETFPISVLDSVTALEFSFHHPEGRGRFWMTRPTLAEVKAQPDTLVPGMWGPNEAGEPTFSGRIPNTEIALLARAVEGEEGIKLEATLLSPTEWLKEHPAALVLSFRLPVNAAGWKWGDSLRKERPIQAGQDYRAYHSLGLRQMRLVSWFPLAPVSGPEHGLAFAVPLVPTTLNRLSYSRRGTLEVEFDLGLAARNLGKPARPDQPLIETTRVSFDILHYAPRWGYRAALAAYYRRYPQLFASTAKEGGWWIGPTAQVPNLRDFGLQYSEDHFPPPEQAKANNQQGLYTCSYCEPWMWRIETLGPEVKSLADVPPYTGFLPQLHQDADLPARVMDQHDYWTTPRRDSVRAFLNSVQRGPDGMLRVNAVRQYSIPVIEFCTSPLPGIRSEQWGEANRGLLSYTGETLADVKRCAAGGAKVEGVYFDSVGDWTDISADDHRPDHFPFATYPLTFSYATGTPVISGLAAMAEYLQFIREKRYVTMANMDAKYAAYAAPFLDMIGVGEDFAGDDDSEADFCQDRTVAYRRSLSFGGAGMLQVSPEEAERRFRLLLFHHIYPGIFTRRAEEVERVRPLYRKYIPLMQAMGAAGWEPVTYATVDDPAVRVERYGPGAGRQVYFALRNASDTAKKVQLSVDLLGLQIGGPAGSRLVASDALTGATRPFALQEHGQFATSAEVPAHDTVVISLGFGS